MCECVCVRRGKASDITLSRIAMIKSKTEQPGFFVCWGGEHFLIGSSPPKTHKISNQKQTPGDIHPTRLMLIDCHQ